MERSCRKTHRIAILDDERAWCEALQDLLNRDDSLEVVGMATTQGEAIDIAAKFQPDIFLVDIQLKSERFTGITATVAIHQVSPATEVIILTSSQEEEDVINSTSVGAVHYILKTHCQAMLTEIVSFINDDFNPRRIIAREFMQMRQLMAAMDLTQQEREIIEVLAHGVPRARLAETMFKSESTIKTQIGSILKKLHVTSINEALLKIKNGGVSVQHEQC